MSNKVQIKKVPSIKFGDKSFSMLDFVNTRIADPSFSKTGQFMADDLYAGVRVRQAFEIEELEIIELELEDFERLKKATLNPSNGGYVPEAGFACIDFIIAIENGSRNPLAS